MNYDNLMEEQIKTIPEGSKLLLHACCAPCSSAVLERITNHFKVIIYYYNPNITNKDEYYKRIDEVKRLISIINPKYKVELIEGEYEPDKFIEISKNLENEPERGRRCYKCYNLRLEETAKVAEKLNIPYFCTTLTLSPHKRVDWLNEIGKRLDGEYIPTYIYSDFKKKNGYKRSIELSREYNLYRQDYCGCIYSKRSEKII